MNRGRVLKLYREILRTIKLIPDETDRNYMINWARTDFKTYKDVTDEVSSEKKKFHPKISK